MKSVAFAAAILVALGISSCSTAIVEPSHSHARSQHLLPATCPAHQTAKPVPSSVPGSGDRLLPFHPSVALLCAYEGGKLTRTNARVTTTTLARLTAAINNNGKKVTDGPIACPAGFFGHVTGYFASRTEAIEIYFETSGCGIATNGSRAEDFAFSGSTQKQLGALIGAKFGR